MRFAILALLLAAVLPLSAQAFVLRDREVLRAPPPVWKTDPKAQPRCHWVWKHKHRVKVCKARPT